MVIFFNDLRSNKIQKVVLGSIGPKTVLEMAAVLVVVVLPKSDGCETCEVYRSSHQDKLIDLVKKNNRLGMITYEVVHNNEDDDDLKHQIRLVSENIHFPGLITDPHPDLLTVYWKWWPNIMIFPLKSWNNHKLPLEGRVHGCQMVGEGESRRLVDSSADQYTIAAEDIYPWIVNSLGTLIPARRPYSEQHSTTKRWWDA